MHRLHIAHGVCSFRESVEYSLLSTPLQDIFTPNIVAATEENARRDARLTAGRVYLIDLETCRQFEHGPGVQTAVPLLDTHVIPPLEMTAFDPFSWDVYISKSCTLLSSATAVDEGGSYPSHRLVMIRYGQRASTRYCTITYDGYRPDIRGLVIIRDHSLSNSFHSPVSVLTKRSVHSHAQGLLSAGAGRMNEHSNNNVSPARTEPQLRDGCQ